MNEGPSDIPPRPQPAPPQGAYQGQPPPGYAPGYANGYPPGYGPYGPYAPYPQYAPPPPTNTMAILAIIFAFVFAPLGIVFGVIGRKEIRRTGESGAGLALAGIWVGSVFTAFSALMIIVWIVLFAAIVHNIPTYLPTPDATSGIAVLLRPW